MVSDKDWEILVDVENVTMNKIDDNLWSKYWDVVEGIAVERDLYKHPDMVYEMLRTFDYKKNGKELSVQFLITMLNYLNGMNE